MKKLFLIVSIILSAQFVNAQKGSIIDTVSLSTKQISYEVIGSTIKWGDGKVTSVDASIFDFSKAYRKAVIPVNPIKWVSMGTGSGYLSMGTLLNKNVKIKPGTYSGIGWDKATNVLIEAKGVKIVGGSVDVRGSNNVRIYGFSVINQKLRGVNIRGFNTGLVLDSLYMENIGDYGICFENNIVYDGTDNTVILNSGVFNSTFINTSSVINISGGLSESGLISGLSRGFKVLDNTFKNSPTLGEAVHIGIAEDIEIAYNTIDKVNTIYPASAPNGTHNGIFSITGNGSVHDNKCTNHQGNLVRFDGFSVGTERKKVKIYNNLVWNSWKYSAFEIQAPPYLQSVVNGNILKYSYADYEVYNNTAGQLNNSLDWEGQMLDLYNVFGAVKYYNNLGFRMNKAFNMGSYVQTRYEGISNMINYNGSGLSMEEHDNYYFLTVEKALEFKKSNTTVGSSLTL